MTVEDKLLDLNSRLIRWIKGQRFPPGFDEWCQLAGPYSVEFEQPPTIEAIEKEYPSADGPFRVREFIRAVTEQGKHWTTLGLKLDRYTDGDWSFQFPMSGGSNAPIVAENTHALGVRSSNSSVPLRGNLKFINLRTPLLGLDLRAAKNPIQLINCVIGEVALLNPTNSSRESLSVQIHDCWIGTLTLYSGSLKNLTITGGGIAQIECPAADKENPFTGEVSFKNVFFPSSPRQTKLFQNPHAYRSLNAHLKKLDNTLMANLMRSHQLRSERTDEHGWFARLTNWVYGSFADYGMKPGRPVLWILGAYLLAFTYCYNLDYGTLAQGKEFYKGANEVLLDENGGRFFRSLLLPLHSIINPFGIFFDARKLIVPTTLLSTVLLTIQGLLSDILLVMTALSIRRRYKAE